MLDWLELHFGDQLLIAAIQRGPALFVHRPRATYINSRNTRDICTEDVPLSAFLTSSLQMQCLSAPLCSSSVLVLPFFRA